MLQGEVIQDKPSPHVDVAVVDALEDHPNYVETKQDREVNHFNLLEFADLGETVQRYVK